MLPQLMLSPGGHAYREFDDRAFSGSPALGTGLTVTELLTLMQDNGVLVAVTIGDIALRKVVYDDGRFHVLVEEGRDRIAVTGSAGRASVTYGAETVAFVAEGGASPAVAVASASQGVARARHLMSSAKVIATFRQLLERLGRTPRTSAGAVSVRLTGALIAEVAGESGVDSQMAKLVSTSEHRAAYGCDGFQERWIDYLLHTGGAHTRPDDSMASALEGLLFLEAVWYVVAVRDIERASRMRERRAP